MDKSKQSILTTTIYTLPSCYDPLVPVLPQIALVGRDEELTKIRDRLCNEGNAALVALNGLPGVGKTALAITLAHDSELRTCFKDGILWASLGPNPTLQTHLSRWGALLGLSSNEMGTLKSVEDWALTLRRAIGSRTMLLIIDDAWEIEEALTFKVGGPNCAHLVTTRSPSLAAEIATEGAITVEELSTSAGMALLHLLAPNVIADETQYARELVMAVGALPLALTLIGNYLRLQVHNEQAKQITQALEKLKDAQTRLHLSEAHAPVERHPSLPNNASFSLESVIAITDQRLSEPARNALQALSIFPARPNNFSEGAALAVIDSPVEILDNLTDAGLLEISGPDRYSLHQTIVDYARSRSGSNAHAYKRLITYIMAFIETHHKNYNILEIESGNVLAALDAIVKLSCNDKLIRIIIAFAPFLIARGLYPILSTYLQYAYRAALASSDQHLASILLYLGEMTWKRGEYKRAEQYLQEGLKHASKEGGNEHKCAILANLGSITWKQGEYKQARAYLQEGLSLARQLENLEKACHVLQVLASVERLEGNYAQAKNHLQEGLALAKHSGEREIACPILLNLGLAASEQGNYEQAILYMEEGLTLARQLHHSEWTCGFLNNLGDIKSEQRDYEQAILYFQEGLELACHIEHREWISVLLINIGLIMNKQKNYEASERYFQESLTLARQIGIPQITCHALYEHGNLYLNQQLPNQAESNFREMLTLAPEGGHDFIALAQYGLARVASSNGKREEAKELGEKSADTLEKMGRREALEIKKWLWSLSRPTSKSQPFAH